VLVLQGLLHRGSIYQYPFLAGAVFLGFVLPQLVGLARNPFLPTGALEATLVMAVLCASMCWLGAAMAGRRTSGGFWTFYDGRLLLASAAMSLGGAYFYYEITQLPEEMFTSQWTGLPVAYLFFARMLTYGFAIAVLLAAKNGSRLALLVASFGALFYLHGIVIGGRRQDTVEFLTIILMALWFQRKWCVPRSAMIAGLVFGALFINSVGDYRAVASGEGGPQWDAMLDIDFIGNLDRLTEQGGPELTNAVYNIGAVNRTMSFDFGAYHWNALVFSYVPAQLVGRDLKQSLYLPLSDVAFNQYYYTPLLGSTPTGLSDAFQSFWYFGCLKFFLIAFVMQKLWCAARDGSEMAQLLYMLLPPQAMQAITHDTHHFVGPWVHIALFLLPAMLLTRRRPRGRSDPLVRGEHRAYRPAVGMPGT
jgi:hypothetical protein